jgi:hypothetical protein
MVVQRTLFLASTKRRLMNKSFTLGLVNNNPLESPCSCHNSRSRTLDNSAHKFLRSPIEFHEGVTALVGENDRYALTTRDMEFTDHGVSFVNVGGTDLRRMREFFNAKTLQNGIVAIRTACLADMDVMPNCALIRGVDEQ